MYWRCYLRTSFSGWSLAWLSFSLLILVIYHRKRWDRNEDFTHR
ncbi:hypothetical protein DC345_02705 [Paenibacillus taichungensis]|uniref:Uncharacterized protein n=1 Tax=Paenibacillus taichungensis TaxID=484184 RepID=A0A329R312_9BACL|nr:hypothetical protein DC345_02705 [Paenibacillus taichungensis]